MHEVDMTRCLVLSMNEWKLRHAPLLPRVERVHLQVGEFTCVEPEALCHTWQVAVADSWLAGSDLAIESVPLLARCLACQSTYHPQQERAYRSPCCGRPMEEIVSGRELRIRSVAFQLPDTTPTPASVACSPCT